VDCHFLGRLRGMSEGLKFYPWTFSLSFLFFFISIHRAQQLRSGWPSNVFWRFGLGKASTIGIEISPIPPLIFTGVKKCEIWRRFQHHSNFSRPRLKMQQQDIRTLKQTSYVDMIALCPRQVWWSCARTPENVR